MFLGSCSFALGGGGSSASFLSLLTWETITGDREDV
jgi:hypothetical protein